MPIGEVPRKSILISSAGRRVQLLELFRSAISQTPNSQVVATDSSVLAPALYKADTHFIVPHCKASEYPTILSQLCSEAGIGLVVPTIDSELPLFAMLSGDGTIAGTRIVVSSAEVIDICADKRLTSSFLTGAGLPTVRQELADDADKVCDSIGLPCIVKPIFGSSSAGVTRISRRDQLQAILGPGLIAQEIAVGVEFTVDVLCSDRSEILAVVPRRRIEIRAGEVVKSSTEHNETIEKSVRRVVESLPGPIGPLCVQVFWDESSDEINIIEINARFGGGFPLSAFAGADFTRYLVAETFRERLPSLDWRPGVTMLRYESAVFLEAG